MYGAEQVCVSNTPGQSVFLPCFRGGAEQKVIDVRLINLLGLRGHANSQDVPHKARAQSNDR